MSDTARQHAGQASSFLRWFWHAQGGTKPLRVFCVLACFLLAYRAIELALVWENAANAPRYDVLFAVLNFFSVIVLQLIALAVSYCFYRADRRAELARRAAAPSA